MTTKNIALLIGALTFGFCATALVDSLSALVQESTPAVPADNVDSIGHPLKKPTLMRMLLDGNPLGLVIVLIVSAVITPPDVASQIIVAVPVLILYQVSIYISAFVLKREAKAKKNAKPS